jgi:hypothetical protein
MGLSFLKLGIYLFTYLLILNFLTLSVTLILGCQIKGVKAYNDSSLSLI